MTKNRFIHIKRVLKHSFLLRNNLPFFSNSKSLQLLASNIPIQLLFLLLLSFSACTDSKEQKSKAQTTAQPDMKFKHSKWLEKENGNYAYRKQMVTDLLNNHQWTGLKKDSLIQMLGQPDSHEEGNMMYDYDKQPFLGGLGTKIEAVVFELSPDSTVKIARLNDGGWD